MRRTELLQENRNMRFEEIYGGWNDSRLTQEEAARILGVCSRTFRRYIDCYEEEGLKGLQDKRLSQASHRRAPVDEVMALVERYETRYRGWNVKHFYSWYKRDGGSRNHRSQDRRRGPPNRDLFFRAAKKILLSVARNNV